MVYALGRNLDDFDECAVRDVLSVLRAGTTDRFSTLIVGVAQSTPFRRRRAAGSPP